MCVGSGICNRSISAYTATPLQTGAVARLAACDAQRCPASLELRSASLQCLHNSPAPWTSGLGKVKVAARSSCLLPLRPRSSHQSRQCHVVGGGGVLSCITEGVRSTPGVRGGASPAYSVVPKSQELRSPFERRGS